MRKAFIISITVGVLISCSENVVKNDTLRIEDSIQDSVLNSGKTSMDYELEDPLLSMDQLPNEMKLIKSKIEQTDSTFSIKTNNKKIVFRQNGDLEQVDSTCIYYGINDNIKFEVVKIEKWEDHYYMIIDKVYGTATSIWNEPTFSPNDSLLICLSDPPGYEWTPHGYQIWKLNPNRRWIKTLEIRQKEWTPIEVKWINNKSIALKRVLLNDEKSLTYQRIDIDEK